MMGKELQPGKEQQTRLLAAAAVAAATAGALLSAYISHPQPALDLESISALAATHVGASPADVASASPLNGTVVAITGATSGIGLGLSIRLHGLGATIAAVGRSRTKLERLRSDLDGDAGSGAGRVVTFVADLTDLGAVARAADDIASRFDSVDFLINNAGIHYGVRDYLNRDRLSTAQGYDVTFGVNYLSHFLLTEKLLPLLNESKRNPRILQISSSFHWLTDGSDLSSDGDDPPLASRGDVGTILHRERAYALSKMAQIMHGRSLGRELGGAGSRVKVVSVCPGWVGTNVGGEVNRAFLEAVAYPSDGFGLASALDAMFRPDAGVDGKDWVINGELFAAIGSVYAVTGFHREWMVATGFRDFLSWVFGIVVLYTQKFFPGVFWVESSPESYNTTIQDSLFQWSREVVSEWL